MLRGSDQDVADDGFWDALMKVLDTGEFYLVVITPPCNTHSRPRTRKKTSKPTCLMSDLARASEEPFQGWPFFDGSARYLAPLPHDCPHGGHKDQLIGRHKGGMGFKTRDSASDPAGMCMWLASMIVRSFFPLKKGLIVEAFSKVAAGSPASLLEMAAGSSSSLASALAEKEDEVPALVEESEDDEEQLAEAASAGRQNLGSPLSTFWDGAKGVGRRVCFRMGLAGVHRAGGTLQLVASL